MMRFPGAHEVVRSCSTAKTSPSPPFTPCSPREKMQPPQNDSTQEQRTSQQKQDSADTCSEHSLPAGQDGFEFGEGRKLFLSCRGFCRVDACSGSGRHGAWANDAVHWEVLR